MKIHLYVMRQSLVFREQMMETSPTLVQEYLLKLQVYVNKFFLSFCCCNQLFSRICLIQFLILIFQ
jgi:hypothetical protein